MILKAIIKKDFVIYNFLLLYPVGFQVSLFFFEDLEVFGSLIPLFGLILNKKILY